MLTCAQFTSVRARPLPDPGKHAAALIKDFGVDVALELAREYCECYPASAYWNAVRHNVLQDYRRRFPGGSHK